jgi:hypothetical protein
MRLWETAGNATTLTDKSWCPRFDSGSRHSQKCRKTAKEKIAGAVGTALPDDSWTTIG